MVFPVFFTDLDGTLLDHHTYDWAPARPALDRLNSLQIPLVMVSSKTRPEIEALRAAMGNDHPFVPENGGAIFIPEHCELDSGPETVHMHGYRALILGRPADEIACSFDLLAARMPVRALSRLSTEKVAELTGLRPDQAEAARNREFGEAFILDDPNIDVTDLEKAVHDLGLRLTRGGRFFHLLGENDKGRAVRLLSGMYDRKHPDLLTAALGDSPNDAPMLASVQHPFLVARPDGSHNEMTLAGLVRVPLSGPAGFNLAVHSLLDQVRP